MKNILFVSLFAINILNNGFLCIISFVPKA